jgi:hypothetical protein
MSNVSPLAAFQKTAIRVASHVRRIRRFASKATAVQGGAKSRFPTFWLAARAAMN